MNIDTSLKFPDSWGSSEQTNNNIIVIHETTNIGAWNNAKFLHDNWSVYKAYVQYVIGDGGKIYQLSDEGYVAWGAGDWANSNAPVQIELARTTDKATFKKDYETLVNFVRERADAYGIPKILDDSTKRGIKTHKWISDNIWGNHTDPVVSYLQPFWGITQSQFAKDMANGVNATVEVPKTFNDIYNVVTTLSDNVKGYTTYKTDGTPNDTTNIAPGTGWISNSIKIINDKTYFAIGINQYLPQSSTRFKKTLVINYLKDYGVNAYREDGTTIKDSNQTFKGGSKWAYDHITDIPKIGYCYHVGVNTYVPTKYMQGSGFKG